MVYKTRVILLLLLKAFNLLNQRLELLTCKIKNCHLCQGHLPYAPNPIFFIKPATKILIIGQAPGFRAHQTGLSWNDPSGDRLRAWMGVDRNIFYNNPFISCMAMGFCFPGQNARKADLPPRPECAVAWHAKILKLLADIEIILLVGIYAQQFYLPIPAKQPLKLTLENWRDYLPKYWILPHPSWRNNYLLQKKSVVMKQLIPALQERVQSIISS